MERKWQRWFFYVDIIVIAIFVIATIYVVKDAYYAGYYWGNMEKYEMFFWRFARDVGFQTASMLWLFYRLFRCQFLLLRKP